MSERRQCNRLALMPVEPDHLLLDSSSVGSTPARSTIGMMTINDRPRPGDLAMISFKSVTLWSDIDFNTSLDLTLDRQSFVLVIAIYPDMHSHYSAALVTTGNCVGWMPYDWIDKIGDENIV